MEEKNNLPDNLKTLRVFFKISQKEMASIFSINRTTYQAYEDGRNQVPIGLITKIAKFFAVPISMLIEDRLGSLNVRQDNPKEAGGTWTVEYTNMDMQYVTAEIPQSTLEILKAQNTDFWEYFKGRRGYQDEDIEIDTISDNRTAVANELQARSDFNARKAALSPDSKETDDYSSIKTQHLEKHIGDLQEQVKYLRGRADLLALQNADLKNEIEKQEKENIEMSKRYLDANNDFIEATKESIDLSNRFKDIVYRIKIFGDKLLDMEFKSREDKDSVLAMLEEIVMGFQNKKSTKRSK